MKFKKRMTFEEMAEHMEEHTPLIANRVTVGVYAKQNGYRVYKPMIAGRLAFYYVNDSIPED